MWIASHSPSSQKENEELFKVMKNNCIILCCFLCIVNIPVYEHIAYLYKELIEVVLNQIPQPAMKDRILKLVSISIPSPSLLYSTRE